MFKEELKNKKDEEVLALSLEHPGAFEVLVDCYQDAFLRKAVSILGEREVSQDAVQETFTKIYLAAPRFKKVEGATFKSWGYRILINTSITLYRKRKREFQNIAKIEVEQYEKLSEEDYQFAESELSNLVSSIINRVPKSLGDVLALHFLEGKSYSEIADMYGTSEGAIKTRMYRAKKYVKQFSRDSNII